MADSGLPGEGVKFRPPAALRTRHWAVWAAVVAIVLGGAAVAALCWRRPSPSVPPVVLEEEDDEADERTPPNPGYLGPQACAACHARRVAEFQTTSHFRACRPARVGEMPPGFDPGRGNYATRDPAVRFEMTRTGDEFLLTALRPKPTGEERTSSRIDLVYGAARADEVFFSWRGEGLYELPVVWLHPLDRWGNSSINPHGKGDFAREATVRCVECHNTWLAHVPGTPNEYRHEGAVLGVTCERCHGPGREHVAASRKGARAAAGIAPSCDKGARAAAGIAPSCEKGARAAAGIAPSCEKGARAAAGIAPGRAGPEADTGLAVVNPAHLTRERQLEVCTQCHGNATRPRGPAFSYRPGQPLEAFFRIAVSKYPENDHVANQVKYLRQSKCFQKSDTLTCTTCHNPHRQTAGLAGRACLKCHRPADCGEQERLPAAVRGNCVGCHMPAHIWMNVHFHTGDDQYVPPIRRSQHRIAVYPEARQEVLLAWYEAQKDEASRLEAERLKGSLLAHWLGEAARYRREYRFLAAIGATREAMRLSPAPATRDQLRELVAIQAGLDADLAEGLHQVEERRFPEAIETLTRILAVKPDLAVAHGKLGTVYAITGRSEAAAEHLRSVARCDPDDPYGFMMLGWLAYLQGRPEEAVEAYHRAEEIDPWSAQVQYHLGLALTRLERWAEAAESFRRVLVVAPQHAGGCQGLAHALRRQGQATEAVRFARRAARLSNFQNADVLLSLAEAYADAGRLPHAEATANRALDAARVNNPDLVPQIRRRLADFQTRAKRGD
jgi:tetratricopeptide (TPR) repeat protein